MTSASVSVALCTYNGSAYVEQQVRSILAQSRPVDEIVISDDGSGDDTVPIVRRALARAAASVRILKNVTPLGVTANFEQAIRATTGGIVILCDQDDVWHPDRVSAAVHGLAGGALLHFSDARLVDADGRWLAGSLLTALEIDAKTRAALTDRRAFETLLRRNLATGATVAFARELLDDALPFPSAWVHDEWLTILAAARERVAVSTEALIDYRQHGANQIGVAEPTLRRKIARVLQPRGERNRGLSERSMLLCERLVAIHAQPTVIERARRKADMEQFRAALPGSRVRRIIPVLRRAASGDYQRYCSQGTMDIVRDLLQPA